MAYNPVNLSQLTNNWTYVDPALTGGDTNKSFINTIAYSGSNLCFGGSFIFNYDNYPYTFPFYFPQNQFQYINIAYFDPGTLRFTSLKGIGTRVAVLSTGQAIDEADSGGVVGVNVNAGLEIFLVSLFVKALTVE